MTLNAASARFSEIKLRVRNQESPYRVVVSIDFKELGLREVCIRICSQIIPCFTKYWTVFEVLDYCSKNSSVLEVLD